MPVAFGELLKDSSRQELKKVRQIVPDLFSRRFLIVGSSLHNQMVDDAVRFIDVVNRAIPQTAYPWIVFFAGNVIVRPIQQFHRAMVAASAVHSCIDRRMIVQILPVIDRGALDFVDRLIDFADGMFFFFVHVMSGRHVFQVSPGGAEIAECVQVCGMYSRLLSYAHCGKQCEQAHQ
jgi:hypothetical protein